VRLTSHAAVPAFDPAGQLIVRQKLDADASFSAHLVSEALEVLQVFRGWGDDTTGEVVRAGAQLR
jgi:hypothetical protein